MEKGRITVHLRRWGSHDFLIESLRSLTPEVLVISEESEEAAGRFAASAGSFWLVDPLDGTKEFLLEDQRVYGKYRFD